MTQLYTTGYEGKAGDSFIGKLQSKQIEAIVDIRENPFSRKPGFSKNALRQHLADSGVEYFHFHELGTPKPLRQLLADEQDYVTFFKEYRNFLPEFQDAIDDLIELGSSKMVCLLCFEKDPHLCHRKVIADLIASYTGKEVKVIHL